MTDNRTHRSPSEIDHRRGWFDELAAWCQRLISRDIFFLVLVVLSALWLPSFFLLGSVEHWYLTFVIPAEMVTLFTVALLANHDRRTEQALHRKIDAIASALALVVERTDDAQAREMARELLAAHGLEDRESTDG